MRCRLTTAPQGAHPAERDADAVTRLVKSARKAGLITGCAPAARCMLRAFDGPTMHLIGIPLRRPSHNELAASTVMAVGLWIAVIGVAHVAQVALSRADAGGLLLVSLWSCVSARLGIRIDRGGRHLLANLSVNALLLAVYEVLRPLVA